MTEFGEALSVLRVCCALGMTLVVSACDQQGETQKRTEGAQAAARQPAPASIPMGVTRFFVTSKGLGKGGNLGGLAGADAHHKPLRRLKAPATTHGAPT
jgi:hypothetical protein